MTRTIRTNEAYAAIAYRRTILRDVITYLRRQYIGADGEPKAKLVCEEVFQVDSIVPPEEVGRVVEELIDEEAGLQLELGRFEFTRKDEQAKASRRQKESTSKKTGAKGGKKDKRQAGVH